MDRWVEITFSCLPLRAITRHDVPEDASPRYRAFYERLLAAVQRHGTMNSYYLHDARCTYHFLNHPEMGSVEFTFEGTVLTDIDDMHCKTCDLHVELSRETCDWLSQPIVAWLEETVRRSVAVEFDRFIAAGDLHKAKERVEQIQKACDESGGYLGMYL